MGVGPPDSREPKVAIVIDHRRSQVPHFPLYVSELHPNSRKRPGMKFRSSTRWFSEELSTRKVRQIPFIDKSGKFSTSTLYFWRSYPEQVFLSVTATIYSRILTLLQKRFGRVSRRIRDSLVKISTVYAINKDDYVIDRFLGMARPGTPVKSISNFAHYCAIQLDDDKRFVYSQALRRADWLKFQAHGPGDKSSKYMCHRTHLENLLDWSDEQNTNLGLYDSEKLVNFWESCIPVVRFERASHSVTPSLGTPPIESELLTVDDFFEDDLW